LAHAICIGVSCLKLRMVGLAPWKARRYATFACPPEAARCNGLVFVPSNEKNWEWGGEKSGKVVLYVNHLERNPDESLAIQDVCSTTVQERWHGRQRHSIGMCVHPMSISWGGSHTEQLLVSFCCCCYCCCCCCCCCCCEVCVCAVCA